MVKFCNFFETLFATKGPKAPKHVSSCYLSYLVFLVPEKRLMRVPGKIKSYHQSLDFNLGTECLVFLTFASGELHDGLQWPFTLFYSISLVNYNIFGCC